MYKSAPLAFPLVGGIIVILYVRLHVVFFLLILLSYDSHLLITQGISTTIVLVRVDLGISYDHYTSRTANSANSGPLQLTTFTAKINQPSFMDISEDDPHDARSERKLISN